MSGAAADATPFLPERLSMKALREAAAECRGCGLWEDATQVVFGAGPPRSARMVLVGEQPGDREDRAGEPFVGPAGRVLDRALSDAGIERRETYVTNAVKHFKWRPAGKRRLHQSPNAEEIRSCRPWLDAELAVVKPEVVVALGATAAKALFGPSFRVTRDRGKFVESELAAHATATMHPSSLLRIDDPEERRIAEGELAADLARAAGKLSEA
ncbi:MAG TPA: UdgX family uracil-DNA binding protein [Solirubrobacterales bacterium]